MKKKARKKTLTVKKAVKISDDSTYKRSVEILSRVNVDGSIAMIRLDSDKNFYTLDGIAAKIWQQFNGKNSLRSIKVKMSKDHNVELDVIGRDTNSLVKKLLSLNLIKLEKV